MKRVVDVLYGLQGFPNAQRFGEFKTDLFANGDTPAIDVDTDVTTGVTVSGATTTGVLVTGSATSGLKTLTGTFTNGLDLGGAITNGINVAAAASMTNFIKFNAFAGPLSYADVDPADIPSGGGLGADGCIQIDIGGSDYFIPIFMTTLS